jgi:23S rRNA-/tRNA-specific pseudouridylate synthase
MILRGVFSCVSQALGPSGTLSRLSTCSFTSMLADEHAPLEIVYQDADYLAVCKPYDVRMTPSASYTGSHHMDSLVSRIALPELPAGVAAEAARAWRHCHQLDYSTSGVLLYAAHKGAATAAVAAFEARSTRKVYLALLEGWVSAGILALPGVRAADGGSDGSLPSPPTSPVAHPAVPGQGKRALGCLGAQRVTAGGLPLQLPLPEPPEAQAAAPPLTSAIIDLPIAEVEGAFECVIGRALGSLPSPQPLGREASTHIALLQHAQLQGRKVSSVQLTPHSGRRHQLRVHCAAIGHPVAGDATYDPCRARAAGAERMCLHAWRLQLDLAWLKEGSGRENRKAREFVLGREARGLPLLLSLQAEAGEWGSSSSSSSNSASSSSSSTDSSKHSV